MTDHVIPFEVHVPDAALADLRGRVRRTRWPEAGPVDDWSQGVPLPFLQDLCRYWAEEYDWRRIETRLNEYRRCAPLGPLTDPLAHGGDARDAFHVVVRSLPGYGFSDKPASTGWGVDRTANAWAEVMARLGYDAYGAAGSDWAPASAARWPCTIRITSSASTSSRPWRLPIPQPSTT